MQRAQQWAVAKFSSYGLTNVHREPFVFGRGWDIVDSDVRLVSPRPIKLTAIPVAWTPPTNGAVTRADHRRADEPARAFRRLSRQACGQDRPGDAYRAKAARRPIRRSIA